MKERSFATQPPAEQGFLVGVELKRAGPLPQSSKLPQLSAFTLQDSLDELAQLCQTAGVAVVGQATQKLESPHPNTYVGKGKLEELLAWKRELNYDVLVFDDELQPRQQREIEEALEVKVVDRTALILDIFAQHARTHEGKLQVELAQYEYRLPRLTRLWTHLARQAGGGGGFGGATGGGGVGLRGPGETQLEVDRRDIRGRISALKKELEHVRTHRGHYRQRRNRANIPVIAIVGYTNAGKSTLLNAISNARTGRVLAEDKLFATLDPTTRRVKLPSGHEALFTDTVGFIQKLPTQLVAAFRATLEEINEADLLLHVVDAMHPNMQAQSETVRIVLKELGAEQKPMLVALNKMDAFAGDSEMLLEQFPEAVMVSAQRKRGIEELLAAVETMLEEEWPEVIVVVPFDAGELVSLFHEFGSIESEKHTARGTQISGRIPPHLVERFERYLA